MIAARLSPGSRLKARSTSSRAILRTSSSASPVLAAVVASASCSIRRHLLGHRYQLEEQGPGGLGPLLPMAPDLAQRRLGLPVPCRPPGRLLGQEAEGGNRVLVQQRPQRARPLPGAQAEPEGAGAPG